ncbi:unnamed protein product, partial [Ectocarpus sp. 8 AP-2014]
RVTKKNAAKTKWPTPSHPAGGGGTNWTDTSRGGAARKYKCTIRVGRLFLPRALNELRDVGRFCFFQFLARKSLLGGGEGSPDTQSLQTMTGRVRGWWNSQEKMVSYTYWGIGSGLGRE